MGCIENAIEEFRGKRLEVYRADKDQVVRDARGAERAARDHVGRWLFELLQNSDDARASEVRILLAGDTVCVADNGQGLSPKAVGAICGTDFSDKISGTIGRKGVGFKSVYVLSHHPQVLTVAGEGIEFSANRAKAWLREKDIDDTNVPYQWIPFVVHWDSVQQEDPQLATLMAYKTVVRLCGVSPANMRKVEQMLREWPPHALFAFRHLRRIITPDLEVSLRANDGVWSLCDSRGHTAGEWRVSRMTEHPPDDLVEALSTDERRAISTDGVSFLIAAPLNHGCAVPTSEFLCVHVFYPTEEKGPVRLLLHAEFMVKSDRTALIPIEDSPFNAWIAERLAFHVCEFVNNAYQANDPSRHVGLLVPFEGRESHPVAHDLWKRIADKAITNLRLADVEARQRLTIGNARMISVSVRPDLARIILEATDIRKCLLHASFDQDKDARRALAHLDCVEVRDDDLMNAIAENANALAGNEQWVWACWEWLAAWVSEEPYREEHKKRIERVEGMPMVPISGTIVSASKLAGRIVTWKPDANVSNLPDWLPITFVDDWFRDRIHSETEQASSVRELCSELDITKPGANVVQRAVGSAIEQYWKDKQGNPRRFLDFILQQDWHETTDASPSLKRCPVPLSLSMGEETWAKAEKAYFGKEWSNGRLAALYEGRDGIAWIQCVGMAAERERSILAWLGCADTPRIIMDYGPTGKGFHAHDLPDECGTWVAREFENADRTPMVDTISHLENLSVQELSAIQVCALLVLLAKHWEEYYRERAHAILSWFYYSTRHRTIRALWWFEILHQIRPMIKTESGECALADCWLPDNRTESAIGGLLPVIDVDSFGDDKDVVRDWFVNVAGLRTRIEQLTVEEWKDILSVRIPDKAPAESLVSHKPLLDDVSRWYRECLQASDDQGNISNRAFEKCPLLCRKGECWQYIVEGPRYLHDDNEFAQVFAEDIWLFHVPDGVASAAVKYLDVLPLSRAAKVEVTPEGPKSPLAEELQERFNQSLPYVWAWRSSKIKQHDTNRLLKRLKGLAVLVVPTLQATLTLDGMHHEIERHCHVTDDTIFLHKKHENVAELAKALAQALDVKSEADSYENLLRCNDDHQRREKLLSNNVSDVEIDRCLREYSGRTAGDEQTAIRNQPTLKGEESNGSQPPAVDTSPPTSGNQRASQDNIPEKAPEPSGVEDPHPLHLKDADMAEYVMGSPPRGEAHIGGGGGGGGGGTVHEGRFLTDAEKAKLEQAGRTLAARELKKMGFSVEQMPQSNPGFDLRGKMDGDELRVEVKAHSGIATVVDLTVREYKEYLGQRGYRWELWNVEHLAKNIAAPAVITPYAGIPDDALETRTFRVDLKKCQPSPNPSQNSA